MPWHMPCRAIVLKCNEISYLILEVILVDTMITHHETYTPVADCLSQKNYTPLAPFASYGVPVQTVGC